jgi:nucleotide-binding universal stress UspA family protein
MAITPSVRSVLVATDLRPDSTATLKAAADVASWTGAALHVVHAVEPARGAQDELLVMQRRLHEARAALREQVGQGLSETKVASTKVVFERASAGILQHAEEVGADLIVIGPHRPRGFGDQILGTTADQLVRGSNVACLIARGSLTMPPRHTVVASDLSEVAGGALTWALGFDEGWRGDGGTDGAGEVTVLHVESEGGGDPAGFDRRSEGWLELDRQMNAARDAVVGSDSQRVSLKIVRGASPAEEILRFTRENGADLLVMGTRGERPFVKLLLGSVSAAVARATDLPLLLLPPPVWRLQPEPNLEREGAQSA